MSKQNELKRILTHLRFPFSFFLLPIFLFGATHSHPWSGTPWPLLFILHALVYPSSNGYNSLMDRDTGPIGGIEHPEEVPKSMFAVSIALDLFAIILSLHFYGWITGVLISIYIAASRAYSYRGIRLKKYPILGFVIVLLFQGALVFLLTDAALSGDISFTGTTIIGMIVSALMIGASYPLTQIYQHEQDTADGVNTLSNMLGVRGTFVFSFTLFALFNLSCFFYFFLEYTAWMIPMGLLLIVSMPAGKHLTTWAKKSWKDPSEASYHNAMTMSKKGAIGMNVFFLVLLMFELIQSQPWN